MGMFRFPVTGLPLSETLKELPNSFKSYIGRGFRVLASLNEDRLSRLVTLAVESVQSQYDASDELAREFDLGTEDASALMAAASFFTALVAGREESIDQVLDALTQAGILPPDLRAPIARFGSRLIPQKSTLKQDLRTSELATRVLPSLRSFELAIDVRVTVERGKASLAVPVAVAHLDTDAEGGEVWFQLQRRDIERLLREMNRALKELNETDTLLQKISDL